MRIHNIDIINKYINCTLKSASLNRLYTKLTKKEEIADA